jgi:hypothetical protein
MTEYLTLIQRAVDGLAKNNTEARRALYERARAALVAQLRSVEPALSGAEITKERLALEEAIHKVEAAATRKTLGEPGSPVLAEPQAEQRVATSIPRPFTPERSPAAGGPATALRRQRPIPTNDLPSPERAAPQQAEEPQPAAARAAEGATQAAPAPVKQTARSRILSARTTALRPDGLKGFRNVVNKVDERDAATKAAQTARDPRDSSAPEARQRAPKVEDPAAADAVDNGGGQPRDEHPLSPARESDYGLQDRGPASRGARPLPPRAAEMDQADEEPHDQPRPPLSYRNWARIVVPLIIMAAVAAAAWQYRASFAKVYHFITERSQPTNQAAQTTSAPPKFSGRVPQEPAPGEAPVAGATAPTQPPPQVAQHAVLLEQDPSDPQGKHFDGTVTWRTETVSPGPGLAPELEVHADIAIPERHMTVTLSLRRNTDKALPASHTIQLMFNLPPDFPGDGVSSMPGIFAKNSEQATGTPLAGISVKVTDNYFLLGLSADPTLQQRNVQLLKDQKWFDIAIVYKNNTKAILAVERGPPGDRAFADAFSAWGE